jgi:hypothetical protein
MQNMKNFAVWIQCMLYSPVHIFINSFAYINAALILFALTSNLSVPVETSGFPEKLMLIWQGYLPIAGFCGFQHKNYEIRNMFIMWVSL